MMVGTNLRQPKCMKKQQKDIKYSLLIMSSNQMYNVTYKVSISTLLPPRVIGQYNLVNRMITRNSTSISISLFNISFYLHARDFLFATRLTLVKAVNICPLTYKTNTHTTHLSCSNTEPSSNQWRTERRGQFHLKKESSRGI